MKFTCGNCDANYMIADEKLGARGVKVKCKRCEHIIIVRPEAYSDDLKAKPEPKPPEPQDELEIDESDEKTLMGAEGPQVTDFDKTQYPPGFFGEDSLESPEETPGAVSGLGEPLPEAEDPFGEDDLATVARKAAEDSASERSADAQEHEQEAADVFSTVKADDRTLASVPAPAALEEDAAAAFAQQEGNLDEEQEAIKDEEPFDEDPAEEESTALSTKRPLEAGDEDVAEAPVEPAPSSRLVSQDFSPPDLDDAALPAADGDELDDQLAGAFSNLFGGEGEEAETAIGSTADLDALREKAVPTTAGFAPFDDLHAERFESQEESSEGDEWHAAIDDEDVGPMGLDELHAHIRAGRVVPSTLVWASGMDDWLPADEVEAVKDAFSAPALGGGLGVDFGVSQIEQMPVTPMARDPFSSVPDIQTQEGSGWQPHGLTEVYNAANLAEKSAQVSPATTPSPGLASGSLASGSLGFSPMATAPAAESPVEAQGGWTPGAASALASLVEEEMQSSAELPLEPMGDAGESMPDLDASSSLSSASLPAQSSAGLSLAPMPQSNPYASNAAMSGTFSAGQSSAVFDPSLAPAPFVEEKSNNNMVLLAGMGLVALLALLAAGVLVAWMFKGDATPPVAVAPKSAETKVGVAETAKDSESIKEDAKAKDAAKEDESKKAADEAAKKDTAENTDESDPKDAQEEGVEKAPDKDTKVKVASAATTTEKTSSSSSSSSAKVRARRAKAKRDREKAAAKAAADRKARLAAAAAKKKKGKCDPLFDDNCKATTTTKKTRRKKKTLSRSDVLGVIKAKMGTVRSCGKKHGTSGKKISMQWKISKSGAPRNVKVMTSSMAGTPTGKCVTSAIKRWRFPAYTGSAPPPVKIPLKL